MSERKRILVKVTGIVQGVCFRAYTRDFANRLGLTGYVKNQKDGTVEIVAEGTEEKLKELIKFARSGPPAAKVYDIDVTWNESTGEFSQFKITWR